MAGVAGAMVVVRYAWCSRRSRSVHVVYLWIIVSRVQKKRKNIPGARDRCVSGPFVVAVAAVIVVACGGGTVDAVVVAACGGGGTVVPAAVVVEPAVMVVDAVDVDVDYYLASPARRSHDP